MSKKYYIETYGCQMNVADSEVVASILGEAGYEPVRDIKLADLILVNTCSIRENAEQRVWGRLDLFRSEKRKRPQVIVGVLGCMAERLKEKLLESDKMVDMVVGPDAYRDLPMLVDQPARGIQPSMCFCHARRPMQTSPRCGSRATAFRPSSPSCAAATTCVPTAWCPMSVVQSAVAIRKPLSAKHAKSLTMDSAR